MFLSKSKALAQKTPTSEGGEMNEDVVLFQWVSNRLLNEDKASGRNYAKAKLFDNLLVRCKMYLH
jgi:hypothetical protein